MAPPWESLPRSKPTCMSARKPSAKETKDLQLERSNHKMREMKHNLRVIECESKKLKAKKLKETVGSTAGKGLIAKRCKEFVQEHEDMAKNYKTLMLNAVTRLQHPRPDTVKPWKNCELCGEEYSLERIPRVLPCGHTFCESCLARYCCERSETVYCFIDEEKHSLKKGDVRKLPKNFLVLNM